MLFIKNKKNLEKKTATIMIWSSFFGFFTRQKIKTSTLFVILFSAVLFSTTVNVVHVHALTTKSSTPSNLPLSGLVAHHTFDGKRLTSSTSTDSSGQGNNGTLTNGPKVAIGKVGQALYFDGVDDYVAFGNSILAPDSGFTASFWVKHATTTVDSYGTVRLKGASSEFLFGHGKTGNSGIGGRALYFGFRGNTAIASSDARYYTDTSYGKWNHYLVVYNGGAKGSAASWKLYVNGEDITLGTQGSIGGATNENEIGRDGGSGGLSQSYIDDVRVYNRLLTVNEMTQLAGVKVITKAVSNGSLVGWWSFDPGYINGNVAKDQSGYGNHATLTNSPTITTGKIGKAINLVRSSSQYLVAPASASLNSISGQNTFSAWLYPTTNTTWTAVFSQRSSCGNNFGVQVYSYDDVACPANNESAYQLTNNSGTSYTLCAPRLPLNQWTHFVGTYDGSSMKVYQNGTLATSSTIGSVTLRTSSVPTYIGYDSCNNNHFDGKMDDVRLYSRALSTNEVTNLYKSKVTSTAYSTYSSSTIPVSNGLIMYQPFDGKYLNSSTSTDITGRGNDGTLKNTLKAVPGVLGQGLLFGGSGSGYISLGDKLDMGTSSMTLNIWFKSTQLGDGGLYGIMGKSFYGNQNGRYSVAVSANVITAFVESPEIIANTSVLPYNDGKFHMLTVTFDRTSNITVYVDGVSKVTANITALAGSNMQTSNLFLIGKYNDNNGSDSNAVGAFLFPGTLDDARVYNRVLTQQEIKTLYKLGSR